MKLLVTGPIFSGKSWLSEKLHRVAGFHYLHEVLNPFSPPGIRHSESNKYMFPAIPRNTLESRELRKKIHGNHIFKSILFTDTKLKDEVSFIKHAMTRLVAFKALKNICIKDPFSVFSSDAYISDCGFCVLFMTRLPVGFLSTLEHFNISISDNSYPDVVRSSRSLDHLEPLGVGTRTIRNLRYWISVNEYLCNIAENYPVKSKVLILDQAKQKDEQAIISELLSFVVAENLAGKKNASHHDFKMPAEAAFEWNDEMNSDFFTREQALAIDEVSKSTCERLHALL